MSKIIYTEQYKKFLERLCQARKEKSLTQAEVAKALGKHQSYVAKCESGERRVDIIELVKFAQLYGKPLDYFVE
ncbi:MAG: helix-turn-helix transcriptional regulator [Anaerolineae bacterium]|nr:helix-turn-helix transcriptional regulator [Anaerolineae bacterium]